ncbi:MAG: ATPase, T2SS/T4P/T4SS family, partial [Patescibacteria group bacterium]
MSFLLFLAEKGLFREGDIPEVASQAEKIPGGIDEALMKGGITPGQLLALKGEYYGIPHRDISGYKVPNDVLPYISEESARHYQIIPLAVVDKVFEIGIVDPDRTDSRDVAQFIANKLEMPYQLYIISLGGFNEVIEQYKNLTGEVSTALSELDAGNMILEQSDSVLVDTPYEKDVAGSKTSSQKIVEDAPVTKVVTVILRHAVEGNASDVHIECMQDEIRVRFRVDGVMHASIVLPKNIHDAIVARIKILAQMRLDEKRKPQDGRFSAHMDGKRVDFRVSTFPAYYGEKVAVRILDSNRGVR